MLLKLFETLKAGERSGGVYGPPAFAAVLLEGDGSFGTAFLRAWGQSFENMGKVSLFAL